MCVRVRDKARKRDRENEEIRERAGCEWRASCLVRGVLRGERERGGESVRVKRVRGGECVRTEGTQRTLREVRRVKMEGSKREEARVRVRRVTSGRRRG